MIFLYSTIVLGHSLFSLVRIWALAFLFSVMQPFINFFLTVISFFRPKPFWSNSCLGLGLFRAQVLILHNYKQKGPGAQVIHKPRCTSDPHNFTENKQNDPQVIQVHKIT